MSVQAAAALATLIGAGAVVFAFGAAFWFARLAARARYESERRVAVLSAMALGAMAGAQLGLLLFRLLGGMGGF